MVNILHFKSYLPQLHLVHIFLETNLKFAYLDSTVAFESVFLANSTQLNNK